MKHMKLENIFLTWKVKYVSKIIKWHVIDGDMDTAAIFSSSGYPKKLGSLDFMGFSQTKIVRTLWFQSPWKLCNNS